MFSEETICSLKIVLSIVGFWCRSFKGRVHYIASSFCIDRSMILQLNRINRSPHPIFEKHFEVCCVVCVMLSLVFAAFGKYDKHRMRNRVRFILPSPRLHVSNFTETHPAMPHQRITSSPLSWEVDDMSKRSIEGGPHRRHLAGNGMTYRNGR